MSGTLGVRTLLYGDQGTAAFEQLSGAAREPVPDGIECRLALRDGDPAARCSSALVEGLHGAEGRTGLIGHFEARDQAAALAVLADARSALFARGAARVLGPMNGSTWRRYRFALPRDPGEPAFDPPVFAGEPANPDAYPGWFIAAGAAEVARYESRIDETPGVRAPDAGALASRIREAGIRVRGLDAAAFETELRRLFELSLAVFADNPYYTPIAWEEFRTQYDGLRAMLDPELVLIAQARDGTPIAFQFAYLDPFATAAGRPRAIVKTVATAPAARGMGLAGHMLDLLRERAAERGATAVIHALMHVANFSMKMSARHETRVFRRYALFGWKR
jgi:ribosomal protein S18 acetylase RimI-like enzyme